MTALDRPGVLNGIVVLDLTQMLAGPYCTMMLADHGADVIKVEPPHGDMSRGMGPFLPEDKQGLEGGYFHSINRNKRSIVLDFKNDDDKRVFLELVKEADVVVENFRLGVMERLGLSYETLTAINPALVYASIRGFGDKRTGESPYAEWPAFDIVAQAMGGFMSMTGPPDLPMKAGPGVGDIVPGIMAAFGIVAAVRHAERTGEGQYVDLAMYDAILALCERIVYRYSFADDISRGEGNDHPLVNPFSVYAAKDGWFAIGCPLDSQFEDLAQIVDPSWLEDERFKDNASRVANADALRERITAWTSRFTKQELAERLGGRLPSGPVNNVADIFEDPHTIARDMLPTVQLASVDRQPQLAGVPVRYSKTPGGVHQPGPALGQHTQEVLQQFGVHKAQDLGDS